MKVREILRILNEFEKISSQYEFIKESLTDFFQIEIIPNKSKLKPLGMFIILEKLITHNSSNTDLSITRQIKQKLILLNNRMKYKIDFLTPFRPTDKTTDKKVIELLYAYRSKIAHGENPDFINELQILKNSKTIYNFMYDALKNIIVVSMNEPQLIKDLKSC